MFLLQKRKRFIDFFHFQSNVSINHDYYFVFISLVDLLWRLDIHWYWSIWSDL